MKPIKDLSAFKQQIILTLKMLIEVRLKKLIGNLDDLIESRDSDTKSSMGDKYETGREMIQAEMNNVERQIKLAEDQRKLLERLQSKEEGVAGLGSLVCTSNGNYFLGIGLGALEVEKKSVFCISTASPIGKMLLGTKKGERINFRQKEIEILEII